MDAFVDMLLARDELQGVHVASAPTTEGATEGIELWNADDEQENKTTGRRKESTMTIEGQLWATVPGSGETVIRAARDRAFVIAGEMEKALRDSLSGVTVEHEDGEPTAREAYVTSLRLRQGVGPDGHIATIDFVIVGRKSLIIT